MIKNTYLKIVKGGTQDEHGLRTHSEIHRLHWKKAQRAKLKLREQHRKHLCPVQNYYRMFFALTGYTVKEYIRPEKNKLCG